MMPPLWLVHHGDNADVLPTLADASVDAIVTDPPAGIGFMGKTWDKPGKFDVSGGKAMPATTSSRNPTCRSCGKHKRGKNSCSCEEPDFDEAEKRLADRDAFVAWLTGVMRECLRILKPGGHAVVWALPRTSGWTARAIEDAGFEVRDVLVHVFGQGFPKSKNLDGTWIGWGSALKPASEQWILARKPTLGTIVSNVNEHGTGALNIDASRVFTEWTERSDAWKRSGHSAKPDAEKIAAPPGDGIDCHPAGRWPPNVLLSHAPCCRPVGEAWECLAACACGLTARAPAGGEPPLCECDEAMFWACPAADLDRQSGLKVGSNGRRAEQPVFVGYRGHSRGARRAVEKSVGGASRFFPTFGYHPKASAGDKHDGLGDKKNSHATVKGQSLMRWLCRLVTPPGGLVLDPFAGSGSTGVAALACGFRFIGIEREPVHVQEARAGGA